MARRVLKISATTATRSKQTRAYTKIFVEQQSAEHWTAWLEDFPQLSAGGEWPADAIERLLLTFGDEEFETDEISAIEEETRVGTWNSESR